jgi:anti-anti-sigma factor
MAMHIEKNIGGTLVALRGVIDVACAAELKAILLDALDTSTEAAVSLEGATYLDVTAIQLLWAAEQQARRSGLPFRLQGPILESVLVAVADMGLPSFFASVPAE